MSRNNYAFPQGSPGSSHPSGGMSTRLWLAGHAIAGGLVKDTYSQYQLKKWFGQRTGIETAEIIARAALDIADALIQADYATSADRQLY